MPVVKKQSPTAKKPSTGLKSAWDLTDGIKISLYGKSGTGKTTLWGTFPKPIIVAICSGGNKPGELKSIDTPENREVIHPYVVNSSEDLIAIIDMARTDEFKTFVLDHATGLQDLILKEILGLESIPVQKGWGLASQQQYGQCTLQSKEYLRAIMGLSCNVVVIAQQRDFGNESDSEIIEPVIGSALTPSLTGWLNTAADYICQTFIRQKTETKTTTIGSGKMAKTITKQEKVKGMEYCLRTGPHSTYTTKFRIPRGTLELPEIIVDPNFDKIQALISGQSVEE